MSGWSQKITLRDLAILGMALCVPVWISARYIHDLRSDSHRATCASNLRQIGYAIMLYANQNKGGPLPRTYFQSTPDPVVPTEYTGVNSPDPFQPGGPAPND